MNISRRLNGVQSLNVRLAYAPRLSALLLAILAPLVSLQAQSDYATPYAFSTFAGYSAYGIEDGPGSAARFSDLNDVAIDVAGNVYVADTSNHTIRKVTSAGVVTTIAGTPNSSGSTDGPGSVARFNSPSGVAVDGAGNVYVADTNNQTIRKINSSGVVTTLAGVARHNGSINGTGRTARFDSPSGVAVDGAGNIFVADKGNHAIRKITSAGVVTTLAGAARSSGSADGPGNDARFSRPEKLAVDGSGNVYVADSENYTIRRISPLGDVTTLAGSPGNGGSTDGTGSLARFTLTHGVTVDSSGNVYVTEFTTVRKITQAGVVTTLAGIYPQVGSTDGTGSNARFYEPAGVTMDSAGNLYVADSGNYKIRKIAAGAVVTTLAGSASNGGSTEGVGGAARFKNPSGVALDGAGNVYVVDSDNGKIRRINSGGLAPTYTIGAIGPYSTAGVAVDSAGNVYVADTYSCVIRMIAPGGAVTILAGSSGSYGSTDGTGIDARFSSPRGLALDSAGNVYVADSGNNTIRKVTPAGVVTTLAGLAGSAGSTDGAGSAALFSFPTGVAMDAAGNIYVASNSTIRKLTPARVVTTLAGKAGEYGSTDAMGTSARFSGSLGLAIDGTGNIFVADSGNNTIRKISPDGGVTTVAGMPGTVGSTDGIGMAALFKYPAAVAVDAAGNLYVADSSNNTIRKGVLSVPAPPVLTVPGITTQPTPDQSALIGSPVIFTVVANGTPAPTFQWQKDGVNINGATSGTYSIANATAGDAGIYTVIVSNSIASITSNSAYLHLEAAYNFSTLAGMPTIGSADGTGSDAQFNSLFRTAVDGSGNVYVSDSDNHTIRRITPAGVVTTFAGTAGAIGATNGTGGAARFYSPAGVAVDSSNNVYVADMQNNTIRKITSAGVVTTFAGIAGVPGSTNGLGSVARFSYPVGVAVDGSGNVYVAGNAVIRKITADGLVTTLAGEAGNSGATDGIGSVARFNSASGLTVDSAGNVYVADSSNYTIRKITPGGVVSTFAGTAGVNGSADGTGGAASFLNPSDISSDNSGNLYVTDLYTIRKITSTGVVTTFAGTQFVNGSADGMGSAATFYNPSGVSTDATGNLYVADRKNGTVRKITSAGLVTTMAGKSGFGDTDGAGSAARFNFPIGVDVDALGNIYVADNGNYSIRKITPAGLVTTIANNAGVFGIAVDGLGNVFYADLGAASIMKLTSAGVLTTLAGGSWGSLDGTGSAAQFFLPEDLAVDSAGNIFVADAGNHTIRKITPAGVVTTMAGLAGTSGTGDGTGSAARFNFPMGVAVDAAGTVYVADSSMIRKITPAGVVTTLSTEAGGPSLAVDTMGNVYATSGARIDKITPTGILTTLAGSASFGSADGTGLAARFNGAWGIAVDGSGSLYVADSNNNTIRKGVLAPIVADATVILGDLSATYDGSPHAASASTVPASLTVDFTYDGSATAPTNAGTYAVVGTINSTNYQGSASGSLTIAKATPIITWAAPGAISYGTALSGTQLNATANVAGAFVYNPASGTIPSVGTLALHTTFTPADTTNFHSVSAQQSLVINAVPVFTAQPVGRTLNPGQNAAFSIVASGGSPAPTYQWQMRVAGGGGWSDLTNSGAYSGTTTATLLISNVTLTMNGYQYRCLVTNSAGEIISNVGLLTVTTGIIAPSDAILTFTVE